MESLQIKRIASFTRRPCRLHHIVFTVRLLRPGSPIELGTYTEYGAAKQRSDEMLQMLSCGTVEIVSPDGFVIDRETSNLFHRAV